MPIVSKNKHPFTSVVEKKKLEQANRARKALNKKWPELLHALFDDLIVKAKVARGVKARAKTKQDLGF